MAQRKRYAIVGTGGRCRMFIDGILRDHPEHAELVGLCDLSPTRMAAWNTYITETFDTEAVPTFAAADFDKMIAQCKVDVVIVCTVDAYHHQYIIRAMELGCDAISEKPMTIDEEKCAAIFDAIDRTGRSLRVTFNYRYQPAISTLKEIIDSGRIGTPTLVDLQWRLDTSHGADYFRRWHREKDKSGGLLVHKATHHFDLVNWLLSSYPRTVFAMGGLKFYGQKNAAARGERYDYDRYTGVDAAKSDPFRLDLSEGNSRQLYLAAETDSGYIRDRNVFGGEDKWPITAEDTMAVTACYHSGVLLSYSLIAYCPWEGERLTITGTKGQVEYFSRGKGHIIRGQSGEELDQEQYAGERYIRLQQMFGQPQDIEIPAGVGGHGGGDARIIERIFVPNLPPDPLGRDATHFDGATSVLTGVAANRSIETGQAVDLEDLMPLSDIEARTQRQPVGA